MNNKEYFNGNTVLVPPQYEPEENKKEYEELKKARKKSVEKRRTKKVKGKLKILRNILIVFVVGVMIIGRYVQIYSLENELTQVKRNIYNTKYVNEDMKVELIKNKSNMKNIEEVSIKNFEMVHPDKNSVICVDLEKNNFKSKDNKTDQSKKNNILNYIKDSLF